MYHTPTYSNRTHDYTGAISVENETWITTEAAAEIMDVAEETVRRLCREGDKLKCRKFRRDWQVDRESAEAYQKSEGGRPKSDEG